MSTFVWGKKDYTKEDKIAQEEFIDEAMDYLPNEDFALLAKNGWHRIDNDTWRHIETTQELSTHDALTICNLRKELEEDTVSTSDLGGENSDVQPATVEEYIEQLIVEEECKPKFYFPPEIHQQLKQQYCVIIGRAGSGKSCLITLEDSLDPRYIEKGSTTGIAAVNCGGRTVNSLLKYFNTESLEVAYHNGRLHAKLRLIRQRKRVLGIDEISMMDARQLDIIVNAIEDINLDENKPRDLGLHLIGDFAQLPPIKADFAFKARCWNEFFAPNIIKLEKIWRQDNLVFLSAINAIREGKGKQAVKLLKESGVKFERSLNQKFLGTTLIPNNKDVDSFNMKRLAENPNPMIRISPTRRGTQTKEWDAQIPFEQRFKLGAYVIILRNDFQNWEYVNGDSGVIEKFDKTTETFWIKVNRTGKIIELPKFKMLNYQDDQPNEAHFNSMFYPYKDGLTGQWVIGSLTYVPLRLGYASTIHRSQGLTLDNVQIDSRPQFYSYPSMCYVAISRARTPEGLIIIGDEVNFASKCNMSREVLKWI